MIRNCRTLFLGLMAVVLIDALLVTGASGSPLTADTISPPGPPPNLFLTGTQEGTHTMSTGGGDVSCTTTSFSAGKAVEGGVFNELTLTPTYTGCTAFGFATAHVKLNGCTYTLTTPTDVGNEVVTYHPSQIHLVCPEGKKTEITPTTFGASVCTQSVPSQTPTGGHVVGTNIALSNPMEITLNFTLTNTHYTGTGGACGNSETHSDASYTGAFRVRCFSNAIHNTQIHCTFS